MLCHFVEESVQKLQFHTNGIPINEKERKVLNKFIELGFTNTNLAVKTRTCKSKTSIHVEKKKSKCK